MKKISGSTLYFKRIFPTLWFGVLGVIVLVPLLSGNAPGVMLLVPILMIVLGYFLFKKLVWDLVDEAYDCGDALLFRKGSLEQKVKLDEIINIDYAHMSAPERVTVHSRNRGPIGNEIAFSLPMRFNPFSKSPLVNELIERVDTARRS